MIHFFLNKNIPPVFLTPWLHPTSQSYWWIGLLQRSVEEVSTVISLSRETRSLDQRTSNMSPTPAEVRLDRRTSNMRPTPADVRLDRRTSNMRPTPAEVRDSAGVIKLTLKKSIRKMRLLISVLGAIKSPVLDLLIMTNPGLLSFYRPPGYKRPLTDNSHLLSPNHSSSFRPLTTCLPEPLTNLTDRLTDR